MAIYLRGETWWFKFYFAGKQIRESTKTSKKTLAKIAEQNRRRELEEGITDVDKNARKKRVRSIADLSGEYYEEYRLRHPDSASFVRYTSPHIVRLLGTKMLCEIDADVVEQYMSTRLREQAAPSTINSEAELLLRIVGTHRGDLLRATLKRRAKSRGWKLRVSEKIGKAYTVEQKDALLAAAENCPSNYIRLALRISMNSGLRLKEMRTLRWSQIDFAKRMLRVGKSKTAAGEGRPIPLNADIWATLTVYVKWYAERFGEPRPEWFLFPSGRGRGLNPERPVSSLETAWRSVRKAAGVEGRWHDHRHTLITELAEQGESDATIMAIAGHCSKKMLEHYSHIRTEAKRNALDLVLERREAQRLANAERAAEAASLTHAIN